MTDEPTKMGPYLAVAVLCERVLVEKDDTTSVIRIFDGTTRTSIVVDSTQPMEPFDHEFIVYIRLKAGGATQARVRLQLQNPAGELGHATEETVRFETRPEYAMNVIIAAKIRILTPGLYTFLVSVDDREVTRIPWLVRYEPVVTQRAPTDAPT